MTINRYPVDKYYETHLRYSVDKWSIQCMDSIIQLSNNLG